MAIEFLNSVDFNQNQIIGPAIESLATAPGSPVSGQMYFDSTPGDVTMYYWNGSAWRSMDGTAATGVTTFTNTNGTFISAGTENAAASGAVTMGTIDLSASGTASATTFLRGDNTWATPAGAYSFWKLEGDNVTTVNITDGLRVDFQGDTGITTTVTSGTPNVLSIDLDDTAVTPGSYTYASITVDQQGRLTAASSGSSPGTMSSWTLSGDSGSETVADGNTVDIAGGTYITTAVTATDTATINHDATSRSDTTSSASPGSGGTATVVGSVTTNATGHVTAIDVETITWPTSDNYSSWTIAGGTSGTSTVSSGQTATIAGTTNQLTATESGRTVTMAFPTGGFTAPDGSVATTQSNSDNSTKLATTAYVDSMVGTVVSGLVFKGSWDASSNTPTLASGTGTPGFFYIVSVAGTTTLDGISDWEVGDWAIFTEQGATDAWEKIDNTSTLGGGGTAGQVAYWSASTTLTGAAALTFDGSDLTTTGVVNASGGNSGEWNEAYDNYVASAAVSGTSTKTMTFTQNDGGTFTAAWTDANDDTTYTMNFATDGSDVDLTLDASSGTDTTLQFTAGSNVTLTRNSATEMTIAATDTNTTYTAGTGLSLSTTTFNCNVDGTNSATPVASTNTASRTYKVQVDASDNLVVNVPWTDTTGAVTSVSASSTNNELGIVVDPTTGAVEVGLDITGQTAMTSGFSTSDTLLIYDSTNTTNKKVTTANLQTFGQAASFSLNTSLAYITAQSGAPSGTQGWVIATDTLLGATAATDVMIEIMTSGGQTVLTEVTRSGADITVNFMGTGIAEGTYNAICVRVK